MAAVLHFWCPIGSDEAGFANRALSINRCHSAGETLVARGFRPISSRFIPFFPRSQSLSPPTPAPTATLCQLARQGWPLLVAVLLTLVLGWSALHEGRHTATADAPTLYAHDVSPASPPHVLPHEQAMHPAESEPDGSRGDKPRALRRLCLQHPDNAPADAPAPVTPTPPVLAPGRRQPPSHAPPALLA